MDRHMYINLCCWFCISLLPIIGGLPIGEDRDKCIIPKSKGYNTAVIEFIKNAKCTEGSFKINGGTDVEFTCPKNDIIPCVVLRGQEGRVTVRPDDESNKFHITVKNEVLKKNGSYNVSVHYNDTAIKIQFNLQELKSTTTTYLTNDLELKSTTTTYLTNKNVSNSYPSVRTTTTRSSPKDKKVETLESDNSIVIGVGVGAGVIFIGIIIAIVVAVKKLKNQKSKKKENSGMLYSPVRGGVIQL